MGTPSDVVAGRIREVRRKRSLTVAQLAQRCAKLGAAGLTEQALYNIETGRPDKQGHRRRAVNIDELLVIAYALDVAPVHLIVPVDIDGLEPYEIAPGMDFPARYVREWIRGAFPLAGTDQRHFYTEVPQGEWGLLTPLSFGTYEEQLKMLEQRRQHLEAFHAAQKGRGNG
jgi:DNA-binding XRE family transcriptional regulator